MERFSHRSIFIPAPFGHWRRAMDFNNSPRLSRTTNIPSYTIHSVCCWLKIDATNTFRMFWSVDRAPASDFFQLGFQNGGTVNAESFGKVTVMDAAPATGVWYFYAITKDNGAVKWCRRRVDGAFTTGTDTGHVATIAAPVSYSIGNDGYTEPWDGQLAAFKVWDGVALSFEEMFAESYQYAPVSQLSRLHSFYPLIGPTLGLGAADFGNRGRILTVTGTPTFVEGPPVPWFPAYHNTRDLLARLAAAGGTTNAVGDGAGVTTVTGVGASLAEAVGATSGTGTATGVGAGLSAAAGSATGTSTALAVGASLASAVGSTAGVATATAVGLGTTAGTGAAAGTSTATAVGASAAAGAAAGAGLATATGVGASLASAVGSTAGVATATGVAAGAGSDASATGTSTALAVGQSTAAASGVAAGVATATAVGAATNRGAGAAAGTGSATGVGASLASAVGATSGVGAATGVGASGVIATATGTSTATGVGRATATGIGAAAGATVVAAVGRSTASAVGLAGGVATATAVGFDAAAYVPRGVVAFLSEAFAAAGLSGESFAAAGLSGESFS